MRLFLLKMKKRAISRRPSVGWSRDAIWTKYKNSDCLWHVLQIFSWIIPNSYLSYLIFVIFLHGQYFWRIKFTPKKPIFRVKSVKNATFCRKCQFFALNLQKFTPAKKNLHGYTRGSRNKYQVCSSIQSI